MQNIADPLDIQTTNTNLTLLPQHHGKTIVLTAAGKTVTISVGLPKGFFCSVIPTAAGATTIAAASGVTANTNNSSLATSVLYSPIRIWQYSGNTYTVFQAAPSVP